MKTLRLAVLMVLLTGTAAAQGPPTTSDAPAVTVLKVSWRWVPPANPKLDDTRMFTNPDAAARMAVNKARTNEANSTRERGIDTPPPVLLSYPASPDPPPAVRPWSGFVYEFTVRNDGAKTIRHLVFDYSFTDPRTQVTVSRQHESKVKIRPGMTAKLVVRTSLRPMGTTDARQAGANQADQSPDQVVIQRIKYADGSVWQRSGK